MNDMVTPAVTEIDLAEAVRSTSMLVDLTINMWAAEKADPKVAADIKSQNNAVGNAGRYIKNLLAGCDNQLKTVRGAFTMARMAHYKLTLPWISSPQEGTRMQGPRLLPSMMFLDYVSTLNKLKTAAENELTTFVHDYPALVTQAMNNLAGLAKPEDYPSQEQIRQAFRFYYEFTPIPSAGGFQNIIPTAWQILSAKLQERQQSSAQVAIAEIWSRVRQHVSHLAAKMDEVDATFKEASVEHAREYGVSLLPKFNMTNDPSMTEIAEDLRVMLDGIDAKDIRKDTRVRATVARDAKAIIAKMDSWGV